MRDKFLNQPTQLVCLPKAWNDYFACLDSNNSFKMVTQMHQLLLSQYTSFGFSRMDHDIPLVRLNEGAHGQVYLIPFDNAGPFVLKSYLRNKWDALHEMAIGYVLNVLRKDEFGSCFGFCLFLGGLYARYESHTHYFTLWMPLTPRKERTFLDYAVLGDFRFKDAVFYIWYNLSRASDWYQFRHNDLHYKNIIMTDMGKETWLPIETQSTPCFTNRFNNQICLFAIPTIIDYGRSEIQDCVPFDNYVSTISLTGPNTNEFSDIIFLSLSVVEGLKRKKKADDALCWKTIETMLFPIFYWLKDKTQLTMFRLHVQQYLDQTFQWEHLWISVYQPGHPDSINEWIAWLASAYTIEQFISVFWSQLL